MASLNSKVRPTDLTQTVKVIGAGHPRTGTSSFVLALEILYGHRALHTGSACLCREEDFMKAWLSLLSINTPYEELSTEERENVKSKLRSICAGFIGITDHPGAQFVAELADTFPDAVIICTTRDPERWWKSFEPVANTIMTMRFLNVVFQPLPTLRYFGKWIDLMTVRVHRILKATDPPKGPEWLDLHHAYVERAVKSVRSGKNAQVHYFNVKDGWKPLCDILGLPVPDVPFPHVNDADAVQEFMQDFIKAALFRWAIIVGVVATVGFSVWKFLQ